jgi:hypothetical protein
LDKKPRIAGIFGTSRSGSTWLGSIVDSHREVAYRFEPLHRLWGESAHKLFPSSQSALDGATRLYEALLPTDPRVEKPPFFKKTYQARLHRGRSILWPLARKSDRAGAIYRHLYTPVDSPQIVFKEVNYERIMGPLAEIGVPMVYLLRHPCAVVWSHLQGQDRGLMTAGRERFLNERLRDHDDDLYGQYARDIEKLSKVQKRALLWRVSTETALRLVGDESLCLVIYEKLCADPLGESRRVFSHLSLSLSEETASFLDDSTSRGRMSGVRYGDLTTRDYFSVFRDSQQSASQWQERLPARDQQTVLETVRDSPAFRIGMELGGWDPVEGGGHG